MHYSTAKFIVNAEQCAMVCRMAEGIKWDDFEGSLSAVRDIGPGSHYLGHPHTQENFQKAFFMPEMFDNDSIEQWVADCSVEITERALRRRTSCWRPMKNPVWMRDEALRDYIARREREIPTVGALNDEY